jgi:hypothetical protein
MKAIAHYKGHVDGNPGRNRVVFLPWLVKQVWVAGLESPSPTPPSPDPNKRLMPRAPEELFD